MVVIFFLFLSFLIHLAAYNNLCKDDYLMNTVDDCVTKYRMRCPETEAIPKIAYAINSNIREDALACGSCRRHFG